MQKAKLPIIAKASKTIPIYFVTDKNLKDTAGQLSPVARNWLKAQVFKAKPGTHVNLPDADGHLSAILFGADAIMSPMHTGVLAASLPAGRYRLEGDVENGHFNSLGFALGAYRFDRYAIKPQVEASLLMPGGVDRKRLEREAKATYLVRDLINTPANDMGPDDLEKAFRSLASRYKARVSVIKGNDLLKKNFPMVHAVGRASTSAPRLLDMKWGKASDPKITLVGKGVCFDTGGLNIKPGSSMALMKKDMGGAANVLGLAMMIMDAKLPVRLRVLIPAVENSISGDAFRPGDILPSRKGISVEIGNTDAEGRLVLGDALAYGDEESPDLMVDMATLTGAARVALGPDLPPFFTDDAAIAEAIRIHAAKQHDPLWQLPLWQPYEQMLASKTADTSHITSGGFAGAVTAALFLKKFVKPQTPWVHLDVFGWVPVAKPWAPVGGEAQGIRALFAVIEEKYSR